jgi:hypothetical protein
MSHRFDEVAEQTGLPSEDIKRVFRAAVLSVSVDVDEWDWTYDSASLVELLMEAFDD